MTDMRLSSSPRKMVFFFFNPIFDCDAVDHGIDWLDCWPHMLCNVNVWLEDLPYCFAFVLANDVQSL